MRRVVIFMAATVALAGCASQNWSKPGMTMAQFERDARECDREANRLARAEGAPGHQPWSTQGARQVTSPTVTLHHAEHEQKYEACMKGKGYVPSS